MRAIFEQQFSKGPKAHYAVALRERADGMLEVVYRWENPKSADQRVFVFRDRPQADQHCQEKINDLLARGYQRRGAAPPVPEAPCPCLAPEPAPLQHVAGAVPSTGAESLAQVLLRRRREASWALE